MSSRGEFQKQLSRILGNVSSQGFKFEDVIPPELRVHFTDMTDLTKAREYIKEADARELALQLELADVQQKLKDKQAELEDQPEEFKALKVDFQQAQRSIDYYKDLSTNAQTRAERYQQRLEAAEKRQISSDEEKRKIRSLQDDLQYQHLVNARLTNENSSLSAHFAIVHEEHKKSLAHKDAEIEKLTEQVEQLSKDNLDNSQIMEVTDSLISSIEEQSRQAADAINMKSVQNDAFCAALTSIIQPLNYYYQDAIHVVQAYRDVFQHLSDPNRSINSVRLPDELDSTLDEANDKLRDFMDFSKTLSLETIAASDPARLRIHEQIDAMARSAGILHTYLEDITLNVRSLLDRIKADPDVAFASKGRFAGLKRISAGMFGPPKTPHAAKSRSQSRASSMPQSPQLSVSSLRNPWVSDSRRTSVGSVTTTTSKSSIGSFPSFSSGEGLGIVVPRKAEDVEEA